MANLETVDRTEKMMNRTVLFLALIFGAGCSDSNSVASRVARWHAEALPGFERAITNDVVGWRRTIQTSLDSHDDNPNVWKASATVEFVNVVGGVERTNLDFRFWVVDGKVLCSIDSRQQEAEKRAKLEALVFGEKK